MKDRMERFVVLPFSLGCSTQSCVAVAATTHQPKKPNQLIRKREESDENGSFQKEDTKMDNIKGANISDGIYKIIRSFKSLSHFFMRYEVEREAEMDIGFPTDVKHLSHIGVDGTMTTFDLCSSSTSSSSFPFTGFHLTAV